MALPGHGLLLGGGSTALGEGGATTRPYEVAAAVAFLDGAPDRARAEAAAERLGRRVREERLIVPPTAPERAEDRPLPPGQGPGDQLEVHDIARTPGSLARRWFTEGEVESVPWTCSWPRSRRTAAGRRPGARGRRGPRWSGGRWRPSRRC
ncbi:hypothetical protein SANTM175S_01072 [Streptomyces antimycoticus]